MTWLAIFPLLVIVRFLVLPLVGDWPDILQSALILAIVVPIAVTWVLPAFTRIVIKLRSRRAAK